jgi:hypothetical protein
MKHVLTGSMLFFSLSFVACGSKPAAAPAAEPARAEPAKAEPAKAEPAKAEKAEAKQPDETAKPKEVEHTRKAAKDFLLTPGWDFVLAFRDSDLKTKAEKQCEKSSKGDEAAAKECVAKAAAEAGSDRLKLAPDDKGGMWLIYMGKSKGKEILYTKLPFKVAKEEQDKLVLTPVGQDQGKAAMKKLPKEIVLEMPDEYAVVWQHPDRGKLVFSVKVSEDSGEKRP